MVRVFRDTDCDRHRLMVPEGEREGQQMRVRRMSGGRERDGL